MVFVLRTSAGFPILRKIYDKSRWYKIKALYKEFLDYNPTLAVVLPVGGVFLSIFSVVTYNLKCIKCVPKYNETIIILRPDDPKVQEISKTDNLRIRYDLLRSTTYLESV